MKINELSSTYSIMAGEDKTVKDFIKDDLDITDYMIKSVSGDINQSLINGFEIKKKEWSGIPHITICPNIKWTDGSIRPDYCSNTIELVIKE